MEVNPPHRPISVSDPSAPSAARFAAQHAADLAGFREEDAHRAGLVATELATNLVKHGGGGDVLVRAARSAWGAEVEIIAIDRGDGIADLARALSDGHSTSGTAGTGLGAVKRLSEDFDIYSRERRGTAVLARLRAQRGAPRPRRRFDSAGLAVPRSGETACGDAWQVVQQTDRLIAVVADGLGHGLQASEASAAAIGALEPDRDPAVSLQVMHDALRHTRGAAVAIAEIRPVRRVMKFAGIGNISAGVYGLQASRHAVSLNGTLGHEVREFREYSYPWESGALLVMHSDGLSARWSFDDYHGLRQRDPSLIAAVLYRDFRRERDDVTVVVGRELT
jgi:anti-sigma regulatory factor (Ser/Thr protein kinase)